MLSLLLKSVRLCLRNSHPLHPYCVRRGKSFFFFPLLFILRNPSPVFVCVCILTFSFVFLRALFYVAIVKRFNRLLLSSRNSPADNESSFLLSVKQNKKKIKVLLLPKLETAGDKRFSFHRCTNIIALFVGSQCGPD